MKKIVSLLLIIVLCLSFVGCGNTDNTAELERFIDENIALYADNDNYIMASELEEKYSEYNDIVEFYIGEMDGMECYAQVSFVQYGKEYVDNICFNFKDENGNQDLETAKKVLELCEERYGKSLNSKYNIDMSILHYNAVSIELNNKVRDECYAELRGMSVEEYQKEKQAAIDEIETRAKENAERKIRIEENKIWLITATEKEIKKQLSVPSSAKFPLANDAFDIIDMGDGVFAVTVTLKHKNDFGVEIESTYVVRLKGTGINDYVLVGIARM